MKKNDKIIFFVKTYFKKVSYLIKWIAYKKQSLLLKDIVKIEKLIKQVSFKKIY